MKLSALLLIASIGLTSTAHADDGTWCVSGFVKGPDYGKSPGPTSTAQDGCATLSSKKKVWHFHGFVVKGSSCYACWDEESNTCETDAPPRMGYRFIGGTDCGTVPPAPPSETRHIDPKEPPPPPPPKLPRKK